MYKHLIRRARTQISDFFVFQNALFILSIQKPDLDLLAKTVKSYKYFFRIFMEFFKYNFFKLFVHRIRILILVGITLEINIDVLNGTTKHRKVVFRIPSKA